MDEGAAELAPADAPAGEGLPAGGTILAGQGAPTAEASTAEAPTAGPATAAAPPRDTPTSDAGHAADGAAAENHGSRTLIGDLPPPHLPTPRGALRRSLAVWGWGQAATGRRLALGLALVELAALAGLAWFGPPLIDGELAIWIFVAAMLFIAAWAAVAIAAYRRAIRRRTAFGLSGPDGGAADLLWLAPVLILGMMVAWAVGGTLARPEATLTRFVRDWRSNDAADAASLFTAPLAAATIEGAWERQSPRLRNRLLTLDATGAPDDGIDPDHPLDSIRFVEVPPPEPSGPDIARIAVQIVRREDVSGSFLGLLPTSSQTLVPVADLGWIDLRLVHRPSGRAFVPDDPVWLIARIDLLGEVAQS